MGRLHSSILEVASELRWPVSTNLDNSSSVFFVAFFGRSVHPNKKRAIRRPGLSARASLEISRCKVAASKEPDPCCYIFLYILNSCFRSRKAYFLLENCEYTLFLSAFLSRMLNLFQYKNHECSQIFTLDLKCMADISLPTPPNSLSSLSPQHVFPPAPRGFLPFVFFFPFKNRYCITCFTSFLADNLTTFLLFFVADFKNHYLFSLCFFSPSL